MTKVPSSIEKLVQELNPEGLKVVVSNLTKSIKAEPNSTLVIIDVTVSSIDEDASAAYDIIAEKYVYCEINSKLLDIYSKKKVTSSDIKYVAKYYDITTDEAATKLDEMSFEEGLLDNGLRDMRTHLEMWKDMKDKQYRIDEETITFVNEHPAYHPWMIKNGKLFNDLIAKAIPNLSLTNDKAASINYHTFYYWLVRLDDSIVETYSIKRDSILKNIEKHIEGKYDESKLSHGIVYFIINIDDETAWDTYIKPFSRMRCRDDSWTSFVQYIKKQEYDTDKVAELIIDLAVNKLIFYKDPKNRPTNMTYAYPIALSTFVKKHLTGKSSFFMTKLSMISDSYATFGSHSLTTFAKNMTQAEYEYLISTEKELLTI